MRQGGEVKKMDFFFKLKVFFPPLRHQKVKIIMKKLNEAKVLQKFTCGFDLDTVNFLVINL